MVTTEPILARARTDARDWLVMADEPLAGLQRRAGGDLPGLIASPALLELVRRARTYGLRLARPIVAQDDSDQITAWVEVAPEDEGEGCTIAVASWQAVPLLPGAPAEAAERSAAVNRHLAELTARLGPGQEVLSAHATAPDLAGLQDRMRAGIGCVWTDFVTLAGPPSAQPLHWRLLDGAEVRVEGSTRDWRASLLPQGAAAPGSAGFELLLIADRPLAPPATPAPAESASFSAALGRDIAPVLRQPIARIIANAETIRTQLAGPLADEYSRYAADIATAGEHLLALLDDFVAMEFVEDEQFAPAPDRIDLADLARRAAGILGVRARERGVTVEPPAPDATAPAIGEFRRVLQVLLNLLGNAIRYSPEGSHVSLSVERDGDRARVSVSDNGPGLTLEQQGRLFDKFERLGRTGDGGSGLGLYISRRLARAMEGELSVESTPGAGARFTLDLPGDPEA